MITKKQKRAAERIAASAYKKARNFEHFVRRVAKRRLKDPGDAGCLMTNFCCLPSSLRMSIGELLSYGQSICGGVAVFFDRGELCKPLPHWTCQNRDYPAIIMVAYMESHFYRNGDRK